MASISRVCVRAVVVAMGLLMTPAYAQIPPGDPAVNGTWSGRAIQDQQSIEFIVMLQIAYRRAEISYPELKCSGALRRVGVSSNYVFFAETITSRERDDTCPDGTVTIARAGDKLAWAWFGVVNGEILSAQGVLDRQAGVVPDDGMPATGSIGPLLSAQVPLPRRRPRVITTREIKTAVGISHPSSFGSP
jgi:hypothetical protein